MTTYRHDDLHARITESHLNDIALAELARSVHVICPEVPASTTEALHVDGRTRNALLRAISITTLT